MYLFSRHRAKTVKNSVSVNIELTAEEWRARYEKEKAKNERLKAQLQSMEAELRRWRAGESVPQNEQSDKNPEIIKEIMIEQKQNNSNTITMSEEEKNKWEEERAKLFEQLDEKVRL